MSRPVNITVRTTWIEKDEAMKDASELGLSLSDYVRALLRAGHRHKRPAAVCWGDGRELELRDE